MINEQLNSFPNRLATFFACHGYLTVQKCLEVHVTPLTVHNFAFVAHAADLQTREPTCDSLFVVVVTALLSRVEEHWICDRPIANCVTLH
jgi:hypothetical protein